jgi:hypothetical protein
MSIPLKLTRAEVGILQRNFRSKSNLLNSLGLDGAEILSRRTDDETLPEFLRRAGLSEDDIEEFRRRCDEGEQAEDDLDEVHKAHVRTLLDAIGQMPPERQQECQSALNAVLRLGGAARDRLPEYKSNGLPKNNAQAMDARFPDARRITVDHCSFSTEFGSERSRPRDHSYVGPSQAEKDDFARRYPDAARIKIWYP